MRAKLIAHAALSGSANRTSQTLLAAVALANFGPREERAAALTQLHGGDLGNPVAARYLDHPRLYIAALGQPELACVDTQTLNRVVAEQVLHYVAAFDTDPKWQNQNRQERVQAICRTLTEGPVLQALLESQTRHYDDLSVQRGFYKGPVTAMNYALQNMESYSSSALRSHSAAAALRLAGQALDVKKNGTVGFYTLSSQQYLEVLEKIIGCTDATGIHGEVINAYGAALQAWGQSNSGAASQYALTKNRSVASEATADAVSPEVKSLYDVRQGFVAHIAEQQQGRDERRSARDAEQVKAGNTVFGRGQHLKQRPQESEIAFRKDGPADPRAQDKRKRWAGPRFPEFIR